MNPGVPLSTAAVFAAFDARPAQAPPALDPELGLDLGNDLEPAAERLCPAIAPLRERLRGLGARAVALSGSGPTALRDLPGRCPGRPRAGRGRLRPAGLGPGRAGAESWVV